LSRVASHEKAKTSRQPGMNESTQRCVNAGRKLTPFRRLNFDPPHSC
jgi:hypothetical protein